MSLEEQIEYTGNELKAYKAANFACPAIIDWLESVLRSLHQLKHLI